MKAVFYLNDQGVNVYSDHCRKPISPQFFKWDEPQAIEEWLSEFPERAEVSLVFDLVDEDLNVESVPKLYLWERAAIRNQVKERLESEGADFVYTHWTGLTQTNPEGRLEELILSSSIIAPSHIVTFVNMLEEAGLILTGIYSAPFLINDFTQTRLKPALHLSKKDLNSPFFVISKQSDNSYRQTFFNQGQLRISRLIEIEKEEGDYDGIQSALIHEAKLARNYIYNQNLSEHQHAIGYIFIDNDERCIENLAQRCLTEGLIISEQEMQEAVFKTVTFQSVAPVKQICGERLEPNFSATEALSDYVLSARPEKIYFNEYVKNIQNVLLGHRGLLGLNGLVFLGLLVYTAFVGINTYISEHRLELLAQQIENHKIEKARLQKEVALQIDAKEIKASVDFSESILDLKADRTVGFKMKPITEVFGRHEHIQVMQLEWKQQEHFDSPVYEVELQGWVFPYEEYFRKPVEWVDAFIEDLKNVESISQIDLIEEPLNRNLKQALTVKMKEQTVTALPFKIKMRVSHVQSN